MKLHFTNQKEKREENNSLVFQISIDPNELKIKESPAGVRFEFTREFKNLNEPGAPSLPSKILQVALPADAAKVSVSVVSDQPKKLFDAPVFIEPVPEYQVAMQQDGKHQDGKQRLDKHRIENIKNVIENRQTELRSIPDSQQRLVPHLEKYNRYLSQPSPAAELMNTTLVGNNIIAAIRINPVTINAEHVPVLNHHFTVTVSYSREAVKATRKMTMRSLSPNKAIQESLIDQVKTKVINPHDVIDISHIPWLVFGQYDYLVITDNNRWNSDSMEAGDSAGDMVTVFQKLVAWKRQKGLKARVVTVRDIVDGHYGDFKTGAVDLQEVLRNFLKFAHSNWGVTWCLLGGDIEIIPVRKAAGEARGDVNEQAVNNPPADNEGFWTGSFMKIKAVSLGEWFSVNDDYLRLTNKNTGRLIPKKAPLNFLNYHPLDSIHLSAGVSMSTEFRFETTEQFRSRLGWYFCTDDTYNTYSSTPTNFVRVDGNAAIIHAPLRFHYTWNTIPTDFYYASLFGPNYGIAGRHDWDFNNNRMYGQHEGSNEFDPINWHSDIIVGRAPSSSPAEATVFVNKVIAYEKFRMEDGTALDRNYLDKMLLVSTNWGGRIGFYPVNTNPPGANQFYTDAVNHRAIIKTNDDTAQDWNWELVSWNNDNDVWLIPYNQNAAAGVRGWYYAFSPTDLRPAIMQINLPFNIHFDFPLITHTIVVYGNAADIAPSRFIFDRVEADGSMMDQEDLRQQADGDIALLQRFNRLYEDIDSLPVANRNAAPISRFTDAALTAALNEGQHFLSLSGHGSMDGCCGVDGGTAASATNGNKYFIAFADSCLTNDFEWGDSMSEKLINNPNGGAVAYLGHTRFSWIGLGDDYERAFFHELINTRHIGLMHNSRLNILMNHPQDHYHRWTVLALNLVGDPEMEVWRSKPRILNPHLFYEVDKLYLRIYEGGFSRKQVKNFEARIIAGEQSQQFISANDGSIVFEKEWLEKDDFELAVNMPGAAPHYFTAQQVKAVMAQARPIEPVQEDDGVRMVMTMPPAAIEALLVPPSRENAGAGTAAVKKPRAVKAREGNILN